MKLITDHAELLLRRLLGQLQGDTAGWRCQIFFFSESPTLHKQMTSSTGINLLQTLIKDIEGQGFLHESGDLYLFTQGVSLKILQKLEELVRAIGGEDGALMSCELLDVSVSLPMLRELVAVREVKVAPSKDPAEHVRQLLIDPELIKSLGTRRTKRPPQALVIEDDEFSRRLLRNALRGHVEVKEAETAVGGLNDYLIKAPDIVFLDIDLPDMNGLEIIKSIKSYDPDAYIVMLSANASGANIKHAVEQGAKGFIGKPFSRDKLMGTLAKCAHLTKKHVEVRV